MGLGLALLMCNFFYLKKKERKKERKKENLLRYQENATSLFH